MASGIPAHAFFRSTAPDTCSLVQPNQPNRDVCFMDQASHASKVPNGAPTSPYAAPGRTAYRLVKRLVDVCAAGAGLAVTSPLLAATALLVWRDMGRPLIYRQQRPGLHGRPLTLVKFRTMRSPRPGEPEIGNDAGRITALGAMLRATSLDELPTLWNVLRGDMTLVGPRPLLMQYLALYTPEQARRHEVKPGITGWAQVNGRNALSWEEKFTLDVWYVDHQSLALDARILWQTLAKVVRREGIAQDGHVSMPVFTGSQIPRIPQTP